MEACTSRSVSEALLAMEDGLEDRPSPPARSGDPTGEAEAAPSTQENEVKVKEEEGSSPMRSESLFYHSFRNTTSCGKVSLHILKQPESQHRARYKTEGSRGAIKDRSQNSFPTVQLRGLGGACGDPTVLQVFIGNDQGDPVPHVHYQACKVTGKSSTPCLESEQEGTNLILIDVDPAKSGVVTCDCVGILKERHTDIEGKMPKQKNRKASSWRKKSGKCRMVFRTTVRNTVDGEIEMLQVVSSTISCTQLPGTPEISKVSLTSCPADGGLDLWMIGKNFLRDCTVVFRESAGSGNEELRTGPLSKGAPNCGLWAKEVQPVKEYLHSSHLIVPVPPFWDLSIDKGVTVAVSVRCGGKESDSIAFSYTPLKGHGSLPTGPRSNLVVALQRQPPRTVVSRPAHGYPRKVTIGGGASGIRTTRLATILEHRVKQGVTRRIRVVAKRSGQHQQQHQQQRLQQHLQQHLQQQQQQHQQQLQRQQQPRQQQQLASRKFEMPDLFSEDTVFDDVDSVDFVPPPLGGFGSRRVPSPSAAFKFYREESSLSWSTTSHTSTVLTQQGADSTVTTMEMPWQETSSCRLDQQQQEQPGPLEYMRPLTFLGITARPFPLSACGAESSGTSMAPYCPLGEAMPVSVEPKQSTSQQPFTQELNPADAQSNRLIATASNLSGTATSLNEDQTINATSYPSIDEAKEVEASISIELPPSLLSDKGRLENILLTIDKVVSGSGSEDVKLLKASGEAAGGNLGQGPHHRRLSAAEHPAGSGTMEQSLINTDPPVVRFKRAVSDPLGGPAHPWNAARSTSAAAVIKDPLLPSQVDGNREFQAVFDDSVWLTPNTSVWHIQKQQHADQECIQRRQDHHQHLQCQQQEQPQQPLLEPEHQQQERKQEQQHQRQQQSLHHQQLQQQTEFQQQHQLQLPSHHQQPLNTQQYQCQQQNQYQQGHQHHHHQHQVLQALPGNDNLMVVNENEKGASMESWLPPKSDGFSNMTSEDSLKPAISVWTLEGPLQDPGQHAPLVTAASFPELVQGQKEWTLPAVGGGTQTAVVLDSSSSTQGTSVIELGDRMIPSTWSNVTPQQQHQQQHRTQQQQCKDSHHLQQQHHQQEMLQLPTSVANCAKTWEEELLIKVLDNDAKPDDQNGGKGQVDANLPKMILDGEGMGNQQQQQCVEQHCQQHQHEMHQLPQSVEISAKTWEEELLSKVLLNDANIGDQNGANRLTDTSLPKMTLDGEGIGIQQQQICQE